MRLPFRRSKTPSEQQDVQATARREGRTRIEDRFEASLRAALSTMSYDVLNNIELVDFLALTYGINDEKGHLARQELARADFLIVGRDPAVPVLGISLKKPQLARDRRRRPELARAQDLPRSIVTLLQLNPGEYLEAPALRALLRQHLP